MKNKYIAVILFCLQFVSNIKASDPQPQPLRISLSKDDKQFLQFTLLNQVWLRGNQSNEGTTVMGQPTNQYCGFGSAQNAISTFWGSCTKDLCLFSTGPEQF